MIIKILEVKHFLIKLKIKNYLSNLPLATMIISFLKNYIINDMLTISSFMF